MHRAKPGWHRRLHVTPCLRVDHQTLVHVSILHMQSAYDGGSELESAWWAVEISPGELILCDGLPQALASFEAARLREAIAADPVGFAETVAIEHGLARSGVVGPGRIVFAVLVDRGLEPKGAAFSQDLLSFQYYEASARKLWSLWASIDGKIQSKKLCESVQT